MKYDVIYTEKLTSEQLEFIIDIWSEAFSDTEEFICSVLNSKSYAGAVIAYSGSRIVGACHLLSTDSYKKAYYLYALAVKKSERGKKIGSFILEYVMCMCKEECASLFLHPSNSSLVQYYNKAGFSELSYMYYSTVEGDGGAYKEISPSEYKRARDVYFDAIDFYGWDSEILNLQAKVFISFLIDGEYCYAAVDKRGVYEVCAPYELMGLAVKRAASYAERAEVLNFTSEPVSAECAVMGYNTSCFGYMNFFLD